MSDRTVRRFVDGLLRGRATERAQPDDDDVQEMSTAIELRAGRLGSDAPSEDFVADLHRRLAGALEEDPPAVDHPRWAPRRREVVIGGSVAAASAAAGLVVGRNLLAPNAVEPQTQAQRELKPNSGTWRAVGASADLPDGSAMAFDLGSVTGFVHRADDRVEAVSGICTHQGCKLWLDAPEQRLRCPCHLTSFSLEGTTVTHQLPVAPAPLPKFEVREAGGVIEVFAPTESA